MTAALQPHAARPDATSCSSPRSLLDDGSTRWAQGGIAAALGPATRPSSTCADTLVAGAGICDVDAVRALVTEGPARCAG